MISGMAMWVVPQTLPQQNNCNWWKLLKKLFSKKNCFQVSGNCSKAIWQMEKHSFKKTWHLGKKSESLWHLSHDLLPLLSPSLAWWKPYYGQLKPGAQGCFFPSSQAMTISSQEKQATNYPYLQLQASCCRSSNPGKSSWEIWGSFLPLSPHSYGSIFCSRMRILDPIIPACSNGQSFMPGEASHEVLRLMRLMSLHSVSFIKQGCHSNRSGPQSPPPALEWWCRNFV